MAACETSPPENIKIIRDVASLLKNCIYKYSKPVTHYHTFKKYMKCQKSCINKWSNYELTTLWVYTFALILNYHIHISSKVYISYFNSLLQTQRG